MSIASDSITSDPLSTQAQTPDRVHYATGVLLNAEDFEHEQQYHRGRLARALAYLHGYGTLAGLRVEFLPAEPGGREEQIIVHPGLALDRLGRLIEVRAPACIRLNRWYRNQPATLLVQALHPRIPPRSPVPDDPYNGVVVDVFVRFAVCAHGKTPAFASGPFDALDAVVPSRLRDHYQLDLLLRTEDRPPLPRSRWPDLQSIADADERAQELRKAVYAAWREGTDSWNEASLLPEHVPDQDSTSVFLARLQLPASGPPAAGERPARTAGAAVVVDDRDRPFVYSTDLLAQFVGLVKGHPLEDDDA